MGRLFILSLFLAASLAAQDREPVVIDQHHLARVSSPLPEQTASVQSVARWRASSERVDFRVADGGSAVYATASPGAYELTQEVTTVTIDWDLKTFSLNISQQRIPFTVLGQPDPPPPPPKPDPPPPPPQPVDGPRQLVIVRETADSTPDLSRLIVSLRSGSAADYLASKSHKLSVLDDDAIDSMGKPLPAMVEWRKIYEPIGLPCLIISDGTKLLASVKLPGTAAEILELLKSHGG